jgi:hypothetical protein
MRDGNIVREKFPPTKRESLEGSYEGWKPLFERSIHPPTPPRLEGSYEGWKRVITTVERCAFTKRLEGSYEGWKRARNAPEGETMTEFRRIL